MPQISSEEVERIASEVVRYISSHPAAADTDRGIATWWLVSAVHPSLVLVNAALERLVRRGILARRRLPDGKCVYARAASSGGNVRVAQTIGEP